MIVHIILMVGIVLAAIIFHEYAHGWTAYKLGDPTAKNAGRLSFNPIKHIDPVGTILVPGALIALRFMGVHTFVFGWAKPVPVNFARLNNPKRDMIWVGLAGPAVNIILACLFRLLLNFELSPQFYELGIFAVFVNLLLAIFNMIPVPPLDGSRLVMGLLPNRLAYEYSKLERYGILIVVVLLYLGIFERFIIPAILAAGRILGIHLS